MKFFLDTADVDEIRKANDMGLLDGVTTNPSLVAKTGRKFSEVIVEILDIVKGPVSLEVVSTDYDGMMREAEDLLKQGDNVVIKAPLTPEGIKATKALSDQGAKVNVTLCFSANQALLAAKAGAAYISPFIGRLDDIGVTGMQLIGEIAEVYRNYDFGTEILAASIRHPQHVLECGLARAAVAVGPGAAQDAQPGAAPAREAFHGGHQGGLGARLRHDQDLLEAAFERLGDAVERLAHEIQFCFGCPPQVLGKNINSERMASSNRLTELALNHFRTHTRKLKQLLAQVFDVLGDGVTFGHCASTHTLEQVGQFLKPKDFIDLYACAYELETSQFDKTLVRRWQEAQTPDQKKADSEESKAKKSRERQDVSN